jgi:Raf kinase inhibitor-like YbhB/YbcL family protein
MNDKGHVAGKLGGPFAVSKFFLVTMSCVVGCNSTRDAPSGPATSFNSTRGTTMAITITGGAFQAGQPIPKPYTGDGDDRSPPLSWTGVPAGAKELALICDDPDAPSPQPWVHWVIYKVPAETKSLEEGIPRKPRPPKPAGALQGVNSFDSDNIGYRGPAPPKGHGVHHYHFRLYALDKPLDLEPALDKKAVLAAMEGHILAQGEIVGAYQR